jgi:hypothetical protein
MKRVKDRDVRFVRACLHDRWLEILLAFLSFLVFDPLNRTASLLMQMTFNEAMYRRFAPRYTHGEVVRFVAKARGRLRATTLDPVLAEHVVLQAIGGEQAPSKGRWRRMVVRLQLLRAHIAELGLDDDGINELVDQARLRADEWLRASRPAATDPGGT